MIVVTVIIVIVIVVPIVVVVISAVIATIIVIVVVVIVVLILAVIPRWNIHNGVLWPGREGHTSGHWRVCDTSFLQRIRIVCDRDNLWRKSWFWLEANIIVIIERDRYINIRHGQAAHRDYILVSECTKTAATVTTYPGEQQLWSPAKCG